MSLGKCCRLLSSSTVGPLTIPLTLFSEGGATDSTETGPRLALPRCDSRQLGRYSDCGAVTRDLGGIEDRAVGRPLPIVFSTMQVCPYPTRSLALCFSSRAFKTGTASTEQDRALGLDVAAVNDRPHGFAEMGAEPDHPDTCKAARRSSDPRLRPSAVVRRAAPTVERARWATLAKPCRQPPRLPSGETREARR